MEDIRRCKKCGARLLEHEMRCPVCGTMQDSLFFEDEEVDGNHRSYWKSHKIWMVFLVLVVITSGMGIYVKNNPVVVTGDENTATDNAENSEITIKGKTNAYAAMTNVNGLGRNYVNDDKVYIKMATNVACFDLSLKEQSSDFDFYATNISENDDSWFYIDENNNYNKVDKKSKQKDVLLQNVYYVQRIDKTVYYQNDGDDESIHCLNLTSNEDTKLNQENSYNLIIDNKAGLIFYTNKDKELKKMKLDGSEQTVVASEAVNYTYDGEYLYYLDSKGVNKMKLGESSQLIYERSNLSAVNFVDKYLLVSDGVTLYKMDFAGKDAKKLYTMNETGKLSFEIVGNKILILSRIYTASEIDYEIIGTDGKRHTLSDNSSPIIQGQEV